jgi:serine protease Do
MKRYRILLWVGLLSGVLLHPVSGAEDLHVGPRALSEAFRKAAKIATPSVVTVIAYGQSEASEETASPFDPMPRDRTDSGRDSLSATGLGSGVVITAEGVVVTNHHVIAGAEKVIVRLQDGRELETTDIKSDPDSDLATLRLNTEGIELEAATLGDSRHVEIGDWVLAIGSPFRLEATVSAGIISAKDRSLNRIRRGRLLQTDAAINPGNSGGALVDLDGQIVGINTAIATRNGSYQGIGFAIPIAQAQWVANELIDHGRVRRAALGIRLVELNAGVAAKMNLPVGLGVLAYQVIDESAADLAGIKPLDVILEFAHQRVRKPSDLQELVERLPIGSTQQVKVSRDGEEIELEVTLAPLDDPTQVQVPAASE